jgi:CRP-like cAMP-binding protein
LNGTSNSFDTDFDKLNRLQGLSWLSTSELGLLAAALASANFEKPQIILRENALSSEAHILLKGIARITCQNARSKRITIALLGPGPIPEFPSLPLSDFSFQCEAYNDCRVGSLSWNDFDAITVHSPNLAFKKFHENDLRHWYRLLRRTSGFWSRDLRERVGLTLLELGSDFGVKESRGTLLRTAFSHQDIADLACASRPRVTEHLAQFERDHLVIRQGRQLIICVDALGDAIAIPLSPKPRREPKNIRRWPQARSVTGGAQVPHIAKDADGRLTVLEAQSSRP